MPRKARDVRSQLTGKFQFQPAEGRATGHEFYYLEVPGAPKVITKFSRGKSEIRDDILGFMAKQLKVSGTQFARMMDCTLSNDEYRDNVVTRAKAEGRYLLPER